MEEPNPEVLELFDLLARLNKETDKTIEHVNAIKQKGVDSVKRADAAVGSDTKKKKIKISHGYLKEMCDRMAEINEELDLVEDDEQHEEIPFMSVGCNRIELKFMSAQNPWDFWLFDDKIDKTALQKLLLKKYQNNLLDVYKTPKLQDSVCFLERNKVFRGIVVQVVNADKLKIQDCDSNSCRVVAREKVFQADLDACETHASALHCTISKNTQEKLWDSDLQALFCDILKEAVLSVQILERLPTNSFLVNVEIEDDGNRANLNSWIVDRLLPEIQKLKQDDSDDVYEFLSSEVTDPYHCPTRVTEGEVDETNSSNQVPEIKITKNLNQVPKVKVTSNTNQEPEFKITIISNQVPQKVTNNSDQVPEIRIKNNSNQLPEVKETNNTNQEPKLEVTNNSDQGPEIRIKNNSNQLPEVKETNNTNQEPKLEVTKISNQVPLKGSNNSNQALDVKDTNNSNQEPEVMVTKTSKQETEVMVTKSSKQETEVMVTESSKQETEVKKTNNIKNYTEVKKPNGLKLNATKTNNCEELVSSSNDSDLINNLNLASGKDSAVVRNIELNKIKETNDLDSTNVSTSNLEVGPLSASSSENDSNSCNLQQSRSNSVGSTTDSIRSFESLQSSHSNEMRTEIVPLVAQPPPVVPVELGNLPIGSYVPPPQYYPPPQRAPLFPPHFSPPYAPFNHPPQYAYHTTVYQGVPISYQSNLPEYYRPPLPPPRVTSYMRPIQDLPRPRTPTTHMNPPPPTNTRNATRSSGTSSNVCVEAKEFIPHQLRQSRENLTSQSAVIKENGRVSPPPDTDKTYHFDLKSPTSLLKPNENLRVVVTHIISPAKFYVNFSNENYELLNNMQGDMLIYYSNRQPLGYTTWQQARKSLGKFCVAKWSFNDHYYRVEVLDWALGDNQVKVFFVDYGRTVELHLNCLHPLTQSFSKLSMCAQRCHLAKVRPPNGQKEWPQDSIDTFKSKVKEGQDNTYSITVIPAKKEELRANSLTVMLYHGRPGDLALSIDDEMKNCGRAWSSKPNRIEIPPSSSSSSVSDVYQSLEMSPISENADLPVPLLSPELFIRKQRFTEQFEDAISLPHLGVHNGRRENGISQSIDSWDPSIDSWESEDFYGAHNNPRIDTDDIGVALTGYKAMDEARVCKFGVDCRKANCRKEHTQLNFDDITTDKVAIHTKGVDINLPVIGDTIRVKVTFVEDVDLFYIQLEESKGIALDDEDRQTLSLLTESMNRPENVRRMQHLQVAPALAELVLAEIEGMWHRARVIDIDGKEEGDWSFEVCFIDYGSATTLKMENLREMESQYMHLPIQCIECRLANIQSPKNEDLRKQAKEMLELVVLGETCIAKVYDSEILNGECRRLQLLLEMPDGTDVGEYLIEKKLCHSQLALFFDKSVLNEIPLLL